MEKELEEREIKELELMNENENREFYVYVHIRLDNNTVFYVGKGHGNRAYNLSRGKGTHHDNICKACGCKAVIIKDNLTESQAFRLESKMIKYYVITLGYGINIEGYDNYDHNLPYLTNFTWGGEGVSGRKHSEEEKQKMSESHKGIQLLEKTKQKISEKVSGEKNGMFGKNAYANKTEEEMEEIRRKKSESMKGKNKGKKSEDHKKKLSEAMKRKNNGKKVVCVTTGKIFNSIKDASNYYKCSSIHKCCKGKLKSAGKLNGTKLQWKYLKDYNNDYKGILINPITK